MKYRYRTFFLIPACIITAFVMWADAQAQDFEDWKREQEAKFEEFKNEQDAAFMEMLQETWKFFDSDLRSESLEEDKFQEIPEAPERPSEPAEESPDDEIIEEPVEIDLPDEDQQMPTPAYEEPEPEQPEEATKEELPANFATSNFEFYQSPLQLFYDKTLTDIQKPASPNEEFISEYWEKMATSDYEFVLDHLKDEKNRMNLNDWGFAKLVYESADELYDSKNLALLFTWFMLTQADFKARIGFDDEEIHLLLAFDNPVYSASFYTIEGTRYYAVSFNGKFPRTGRIQTYEGEHPDADRKLSLNIKEIPDFKNETHERELKFTYRDSTYHLNVEVNSNLIDFYHYYPQTNLEVYFEAPVTDFTAQQVLEQLSEIIEGKTKIVATNLLLRFSQTAFGYKIDPENFGREKPLFPEETLFYDYSDCEDRAILFEFLVTNLLGLEVIGLEYPKHIATAVRFDHEAEGDYVYYKDRKFLISDPTYINADVGMEMPEFSNIQPEIISL